VLCATHDSLQQARTAAARRFRASLHDIVALVDTSATDTDFNLAHRRIRAARRAYEAAQDALEDHQAEHGC
jgi:hypothetical protein